MTDKQIIIDGIDVSGCDFLAKKDDYCSYSGVTYAYKGQCMCSDEEMCKEHPKCFYKKVLKQLKRKEQECEELKEELKTKTYHWEQCTEEILKGTKQFVDRMEKAEKTLAEIKEIIHFNKTNRLSGGSCISIEQILQKISEVEDES